MEETKDKLEQLLIDVTLDNIDSLDEIKERLIDILNTLEAA